MKPWNEQTLEQAIHTLHTNNEFIFLKDKQNNLIYEQEKRPHNIQALTQKHAWYTTLPLIGQMKNTKGHFSQTHARKILAQTLGEPHRGGRVGKTQKYYIQPENQQLPHVLTIDILRPTTKADNYTLQLTQKEKHLLTHPTKHLHPYFIRT